MATDWGSYASGLFGDLKECFNSDGSVIDGLRDKASSYASSLSGYLDLPVSISEDGQITIDGVEYDSLETFEADYKEQTKDKIITNYFDTYSFYRGVITDATNTAKDFIMAFCAATASEIQFAQSGDSWFARAARVQFIATPATNEEPAHIYLQNTLGTSVDILANLSNSHGTYIAYFIYKGKSGDCYVKCYRTTTATLPSMEDTEAAFKDISMNAYQVTKTFDDPDWTYLLEHIPVNYGGFAFVEFTSQFSGEEKSRYYDVVLFSDVGAPLAVGVTSDTLTDIKKTNQGFKRNITNSSSLTAVAAPIYSPTTQQYASSSSFWGIISVKDGYYKTNIGYYAGDECIFDHGFMLRIY